MSQTLADSSTRGEGVSRVLNVVLWVLQIGAALMFLMAAYPKLTGAPMMVGLYNAIGIGQWFRYLTGALEVLGALLLLIPRLSGLGGLMLFVVMIGAVATHLFIVGGNPTMAIVLLVVTAIIAWGRRERTLSLMGR